MKYSSKLFFSFLLFSAGFYSTSYSQGDFLPDVQAKLEAYNKTLFQEKLFVHTDKSFYTAGEIIWFKIYALDGMNNRPLAVSKVSYVEILDAANKPVSRAKIEMNAKGGSGSFQLPVSINSGVYTFRAYTQWMRNLGPEHFYHKPITVINPLKSLDTPEEPQAGYDLQVFPEGGNLVKGLQARIAFKLTDRNAKGLQANGFLLNQNNDTLLIFNPYKFGMGSFLFTPREGQDYRMVFVFPDGRFAAKPLPAAYDKGYVMTVEEADNNRLSISVATNIKSGYPEIFLLAQTRQVTKAVKRAVISDGVTSFLVDKSDLGEGLSQFTIFNNEKQPVCERLYFLQPSAKTIAAVKSSKSQYGLREQVSLDLDQTDANLSISVFQTDDLQKADANDIISYTWLGSELKGNIEEPGYYFSSASEEVKKATDLLMLTNGWRKFNWETVLNSKPAIRFPIERTGQTIMARIINERTNQPAKDVQGFLSIPQSRYKLYTAPSDKDGIVRFDVKDHYGPGELILQVYSKDTFYRIDLVSPFSEAYGTGTALPFNINAAQAQRLVSYSIGMQAQHIYVSDSIRKFSSPGVSDTFHFFGKPSNTYRLDDYKRFGTMEEVLREYVREVNVGVKGSGSSLRFKLFNELDREFYTDDILVVVDGVPLLDPNKIFAFDPVKIKKLDVVPRNYVFGPAVFHGLASFSSYDENFQGFELAPSAVNVDYEGMQLHREFYSPDYNSVQLRSNRIPDLRNTLYWSPFVNDKKVQFYTGDNKGNFIVVVQGVDANGKPVSTVSGFEVK